MVFVNYFAAAGIVLGPICSYLSGHHKKPLRNAGPVWISLFLLQSPSTPPESQSFNRWNMDMAHEEGLATLGLVGRVLRGRAGPHEFRPHFGNSSQGHCHELLTGDMVSERVMFFLPLSVGIVHILSSKVVCSWIYLKERPDPGRNIGKLQGIDVSEFWVATSSKRQI